MTTPDLFSAFDAAIADCDTAAVESQVLNKPPTTDQMLRISDIKQPHAQAAIDVSSVSNAYDDFGDRLENDSSLSREDILLPTAKPPTHAASNRVMSRLAGDIVVCSTKPTTFDEAVKLIQQSDTVDPDRIKAFQREVRWIQTRLPRSRDGSPPVPLPCDPGQLRLVLKEISPGRHNISKKRWYNIRGELAAIQRKTGWLPPRCARVEIESTEWHFTVSLLVESQEYAMFRNFAVFNERRRKMPEQIEASDFDDYQNNLEKNTSKRSPKATCDALRYVWNRMANGHPEWGGKALPRKRSTLYIRGEKDELNSEFYEDLDAYCNKLLNPGRFSRGAFKRRVSAKTVGSRRSIIILSAHVLLQAGRAADQVKSLHQMSHPRAVETILNSYADRNCPDGNWTVGAETTAVVLKMMARQWSKLSQTDLAETEEICSSVKPPRNSFPRRAAERLRQFDDKAVERRFWMLPQTLWDTAKKHESKGRRKIAATYAKYALAFAVAFDKPLRLTNLASLDLNLDFERDLKGNIIGIKIEGERTTKGAAIIEGALSPKTQRMMQVFVDRYRPQLLKRQTSALFPGHKADAANEKGFGRHITLLIDRYLGIKVNPHLIRALVATVILDEDPGAVVLAQRMLDHKSPETTKKYYGQQRGRAVQGQFAEVLHRRMKKLKK